MIKSILATGLLSIITINFSIAQQPQKLWYKQPAKEWTEALPVGNGRLGAMVFGGVADELLQLNEATLWTGGPVRTNVNPGAYNNLIKARAALFNGEDYAKAYEFAKGMQGYYSESYLPLGNMMIHQNFKDTTVSSYYRDLNIDDAIATTSFTIGGVKFIRQVISSAPDKVIVVRLTANKPGQLNFTINANSQLKHLLLQISNSEIAVKGKAPSHIEPSYVNSDNPQAPDDTTGCRGMRFEYRIKAVSKDGKITSDTNGITIKNATEVLVFLLPPPVLTALINAQMQKGKMKVN